MEWERRTGRYRREKSISLLMFEWVMTGPVVAAVLRFGFRRGGRSSQKKGHCRRVGTERMRSTYWSSNSLNGGAARLPRLPFFLCKSSGSVPRLKFGGVWRITRPHETFSRGDISVASESWSRVGHPTIAYNQSLNQSIVTNLATGMVLVYHGRLDIKTSNPIVPSPSLNVLVT